MQQFFPLAAPVNQSLTVAADLIGKELGNNF